MKSLLIGSKVKEYSYEDVLEQFSDSVKYESIRFVEYNPNLGFGVDDIEQEIRIVAYNAYNNYDNINIHFSTYFYHCLKNHLFNTLRKYQTDKRSGLFTEDSLDRELYDESDSTLLEQQKSIRDTETEFFARYVLEIADSITETNLEKDVIEYFLEHMTAQEIAERNSVSRRTVYNHINRIRKELQTLLN